jgi:hypothetical protein
VGDETGSKAKWIDIGLVAAAVIAGLVAAALGGTVEGVLDWVFVGIPLALFALLVAARFFSRRGRRPGQEAQ